MQRIVGLAADVGLVGEEQRDPELARVPYCDRLGAAARRLHVAMELGSNDTIKRAVELGAGAAIVSREIVRTEVRAGSLRAIAIREPGFVHRIDLVYHKDRAASPLLAAVRDVVRELREGRRHERRRAGDPSHALAPEARRIRG